MCKRLFPENGFCPGNEQVFDLAFTACVPVNILASNKMTCKTLTNYRKSLGK
jgi:hypothetical protein